MGSYRDIVQEKSPPSTYAIAALMEGEPGSGVRAVGLTIERAVVLATGLYVAGFRGRDLWRGALYGSGSITAWISLDYWLKHRGYGGLTPWSE